MTALTAALALLPLIIAGNQPGHEIEYPMALVIVAVAMTFLSLAAKKRFIVDRYTDTATGHLEKNEDGKLAVARVVLRPDIAFGGEKQPSSEELGELHERAHDLCFVANSVKTAVTVEHPAPAAGTL